MNAMLGRTYSQIPEVGIPLALENLSKTENDRDISSCLCYLGYRTLSGCSTNYPGYPSVQDLIAQIRHYKDKWLDPETRYDNSDRWSRWHLSLSILDVYIKYLILDEEVEESYLSSFENLEFIRIYPPCQVNVIRILSFLYLTKFYKNSGDVDLDNLLNKIMKHYQLSVECYDIKLDKTYPAIYEFWEALDAIKLCAAVVTHEKKTMRTCRNMATNNSYGNFYKSVFKIRERYFVPQNGQTYDVEYEDGDLGSYSGTAICIGGDTYKLEDDLIRTFPKECVYGLPKVWF